MGNRENPAKAIYKQNKFLIICTLGSLSCTINLFFLREYLHLHRVGAHILISNFLSQKDNFT
jgi:hypothetical protein